MSSGIFYPAADSDDGIFYPPSGFSTSESGHYFGKLSGSNYHSFVRFVNVTIPQGSVITSAIVKWTSNASDSDVDVLNNIYFNDIDNAVAPTSYGEADGLALTTAVAWDNLPSWTWDTQYDTSELKATLQIVINREGWSSGNALIVVTKDDGSSYNTHRMAYSYSGWPAYKPEFHITWEPPEIIEIILPGPFSSVGSISIGGLFDGSEWILGKSALFTSETSLESNIQIELSPPVFTAQGTIHGFSTFLVTAEPFIATGKIYTTLPNLFSTAGAKRIYIFTLTGEADGVDDIVIPISSFQSRIKSGDPTYLSIVIPSTEYAVDINLRLNGDLIVRIGYQDGDEILLTEIVSRVLFENVTINEGPTNKSITLDGHRTETWMPKTVSLENASYRNLSKGKLRYRCKPDLYLRPGDIANINDDSFTVESITYSVSPELETYEIAE